MTGKIIEHRFSNILGLSIDEISKGKKPAEIVIRAPQDANFTNGFYDFGLFGDLVNGFIDGYCGNCESKISREDLEKGYCPECDYYFVNLLEYSTKKLIGQRGIEKIS